MGNTGLTCDSDAKGGLRWNDTDSTVEMCDGSDWTRIIATNAEDSTDPTPDAFSFTDLTNQSLGALIMSETLNITGFDGPVLAEVSGDGTPQISVNGGGWVTASEINPGDSLRIRLISSGSVSTARVAAVTVGDTTDNWSVTTKAGQTQIFITPTTYNGNLGGLSGADTRCQTEAGALGYAGSWKAVMSDSSTNAKDRLTITYPVVRASGGTTVDSTDLWDGSLENNLGASQDYWTGTDPDGTAHANTCSDWTSFSSGDDGATGWGASTNSGWIKAVTTYDCSSTRHLACVDQ